MQTTRILAIRHGETAWNVDTRIQGQLDIELNDVGHWQATRVGLALREEDLSAIYSSDLMRAFQTAQAIAQHHSRSSELSVVGHIGLRERHFGHLQGQTWSEIESNWPEDAKLWRGRDPHWTPEGGESLTALRERISRSVNELAQQHLGEQIVLVAHGGVMDALYRLATGLPTEAPRAWHLGNAAINRLLWTPQGLTLLNWGDVSHFEDARGQPLDESST